VAMAASLQAAATFMQPTKLGRTNTLQLKSPHSISKAFGLEPAGAKLSCSLQTDLKDLAQKCVDATKIAGFALATSALVVSVCTLLFYHFPNIIYYLHQLPHNFTLVFYFAYVVCWEVPHGSNI